MRKPSTTLARGCAIGCAIALALAPRVAGAQTQGQLAQQGLRLVQNTPNAPAVPPSVSQTPPPTPAPIERISFDEAVRRALERNPSIADATTNILRAEALLQQARAAVLPAIGATFTNVLINSQRGFESIVAQPMNQSFFGASVGMPVLAPAQWAATTQARDQIEVAKLSVNDVRQQIAVAAAQAYLSIIGAKRQVVVNTEARDSAQVHLDYAQRRLAAGAGSRLNELRAAQQVSSDEARLETVSFAVRRAQEALGVLVAANGPIDAGDEPAFDVPPSILDDSWLTARTDIQLTTASLAAAERVVKDSRKDWYPTARASFDPQFVSPAGSFSPSGTWSFTVAASQPVFDSGERQALRRLREAAAESSRQQLLSVQIQARSEVRLAFDAMRSAERTLVSLRLSAEQADEVARISNTAFEAGATTNLEVIDAQRTARDAQTAVAIAEDVLLGAQLDLLTALGRFPTLTP